MSIYATLWWLKFPRYGDEYIGCEWIRVSVQGFPPTLVHLGDSATRTATHTPTSFLPQWK
jgi:hypothetical protein